MEEMLDDAEEKQIDCAHDAMVQKCFSSASSSISELLRNGSEMLDDVEQKQDNDCVSH